METSRRGRECVGTLPLLPGSPGGARDRHQHAPLDGAADARGVDVGARRPVNKPKMSLTPS